MGKKKTTKNNKTKEKKREKRKKMHSLCWRRSWKGLIKTLIWLLHNRIRNWDMILSINWSKRKLASLRRKKWKTLRKLKSKNFPRRSSKMSQLKRRRTQMRKISPGGSMMMKICILQWLQKVRAALRKELKYLIATEDELIDFFWLTMDSVYRETNTTALLLKFKSIWSHKSHLIKWQTSFILTKGFYNKTTW